MTKDVNKCNNQMIKLEPFLRVPIFIDFCDDVRLLSQNKICVIFINARSIVTKTLSITFTLKIVNEAGHPLR